MAFNPSETGRFLTPKVNFKVSIGRSLQFGFFRVQPFFGMEVVWVLERTAPRPGLRAYDSGSGLRPFEVIAGLMIRL